jgi:outer membrane immunogenic protein
LVERLVGNKVRTRLASLTLFDIAAGITVAATSVLPAGAQDAPMPNWTGFYIGGHAGYRWADANFTSAAYFFTPPVIGGTAVAFAARNENYGLNGGIFGLQGGYNYMLTPQWLTGLEGDWSWGRGSDSKSATITGVDVNSDGFTFWRNSEVTLTWQATIRGRLGYVDGPWLFYGTGGIAFAHVKWSEAAVLNTTSPTVTTAVAWTTNKTLTGWVVGGGVEYMIDPHWIARIEYLYEGFGSFSVPYEFSPQAGNLDLKDVQKIRIAISYKF